MLAVLLLLMVGACAGPRLERAGPPVPAATGVETTVILVGDAGEPDAGFEPVLASLSADIRASEAPVLVAFLGDNIYPAGLPPEGDPDRREAVRRIEAQIRAVVDAGGEAVFVPGNHDWGNGASDGLERIRAQEQLVERSGGGRARFLPDGGCPGPAVVDVGEHLRLVVLDTEWWLQDPALRDDGGSCPVRTEAGVAALLERSLDEADDRHVIALGHHPLRSGGNHGGHFTWQQHLFPLRDLAGWAWLPLPVLGSAYPFARARGVSGQDMSGERNRRMRDALERVLRADPPLVWAGGHEHNLQVLEGSSARWLVVSGGGIHGHTTPAKAIEGTRFAAEGSGYVRVDVQGDGRVRLGVIIVDERGGAREVMARHIAGAR